jgi:uncharacterized protein (DUF302 family)
VQFAIAPVFDPAFEETSMTSEDQDHGFVQIASSHSVAETVERLESRLQEHNITIFARLDFAADAARVGLNMRPERMLIFGNPKAGTPLMQAVPVSGLDLPLKALVWEDAQGKTWVAYNRPEYIVARHGLPAALAANLAGVIPLIEGAAR